MSLRFQTFRQILLVFMALMAICSVALALYLQPFLTHKSNVWILVIVPGIAALGSIWSAFKKPIFKMPQLVAVEATSFFALLPFQLILALVVVNITLKSNSNMVSVFPFLKISVFINTTLVFTYTGCLLIISVLTANAFDADVWLRDIDMSPSPFPMPIILKYLFPCLFPPSDVTPSESDQRDLSLPTTHCLPGCNCSTKLAHLAPPAVPLAAPPEMSQRPPIDYSRSSASTVGDENHSKRGSKTSLSRSLVRIPDAAERRSSIVIAFNDV